MKEQLKISLVSYLNSSPYSYGLESLEASGKVKIYRDHPAQCAKRFARREIDLGLIPVAALDDDTCGFRLPGWGIGCTGRVESVCLLSNEELSKVSTVFLDAESRTSNMLVKMILEEQLGLIVDYRMGGVDSHLMKAHAKDAHLVIGDRALRDRSRFSYCYDLGKMWYEWQQLPFVFAVWAGPEKISDEWMERLDKSFKYGLGQIPEIVRDLGGRHPGVDISHYLTTAIDHKLGADHQLGLKLFLKRVNAINQESILI